MNLLSQIHQSCQPHQPLTPFHSHLITNHGHLIPPSSTISAHSIQSLVDWSQGCIPHLKLHSPFGSLRLCVPLLPTTPTNKGNRYELLIPQFDDLLNSWISVWTYRSTFLFSLVLIKKVLPVHPVYASLYPVVTVAYKGNLNTWTCERRYFK